MADRHIEELAELYALGVLQPSEIATVDAHIAHCDACLRRVGEAEETLLALEREIEPQPPPDASLRGLRPRSAWWPSLLRGGAGLAAGLILGVVALLPPALHDRESQRALNAMIASHFVHAQFQALARNAPDAKMIFARDRAWVYVIAQGNRAYEVDAIAAGTRIPLGTLHADGSVSTLFVDRAVTATSLELRDGARVVERASFGAGR